jgi:thiamine pyrophosphate-dependent acetolactate synthase large subunit-like protein
MGRPPLEGVRVVYAPYPDRQYVHVTGDAGACYIMGNFEAVAGYKIGITIIHINNGGHSGYGPDSWGPGHDPHTWQVSSHDAACMVNMAKAVSLSARITPRTGAGVCPVASGH